ncbi:ATP-binding cassette domain-containing protein, partial [Pseudoclavibacter chungangensis]|uniref:ATP-binding cassette domain-containing protein n=1 Tax=Pseudoclavibacter chungangensis TaxID=587635 RepID=UPI003636A16A
MRDGVDAARSVPADAGDRAAPTPDGAPSGALARVRALLSERLLEAGLGPEGARTVLTLGFLAATSAIALVVLAESIAWGIVGVAQGDDVRRPVAWGAAAAIVRALAGWASGVVADCAAIGAKTYWRTSLATRLTRPLPASGAGTGEAATLAGPGLDALDEYFTRVVPAAVQAAVVPVVLGLRILMDDWVSAIVVALTIPLVPFFMILIGKHTRDRVDEVTDELARLADHLVELARGLPVLVGLGRADEQAAALDGIQRRLRRRTNATLRQAFLSALALELIATISVAVVAVFLGVRLVNGTVELQPAIAALVLAPECYAAIRAVGTAFHQAQDGTSALRRVRDVLDAPDAPAGFVRTESSDAAVPVRVRELTVRRPGRSVDAVHGASVDARRGEIVAITGPSGAGKSTVLAAIAELLGPDALVHGTIAAPAADELAYAPQDPTPFTSTPRAEFELAAGRSGAGDAERAFAAAVMLDTLDLTGAADRDAAELSPGELRRVAVGRALLRVDAGAHVLLLDEPTAHLDPVRAELVRRAIARRRGDVATVLVTHEPETLALADRRVAIEAAAAVPHGTHDVSLDEPLPAGPRTVLGVAARTPTVLEDATRTVTGPATPHFGPAESAALDTAVVDVEGETFASASDAEERDLAATAASSAVGSPATPTDGPSIDTTFDGRAANDAPTGPRASAFRALGLVLAPAAFRWTGAGVLGAIALAMSLGLAAVSGWLIVRASEQPAIMYLLVAIVGVRFFGIGRAVIRYVERLASHDAVLRSVDVLRIRLWRALARRGSAERSLLEPGRAVGLLVTRLGQVRDQAPRVVVPFAAGVLAIGAVVVAIALVTPPIAAPLCVALVATLVLAVVVAIVADRAASSARAARQPLLTARAAALAAAGPVLRANGVSVRAIDDVVCVDADLASAQRRAAWAAGAAGAVAVGG